MARKQTKGRGRPRTLTTNQIRSIRGARFAKTPTTEIAEAFGVCYKTASDVLNYRGAYRK